MYVLEYRAELPLPSDSIVHERGRKSYRFYLKVVAQQYSAYYVVGQTYHHIVPMKRTGAVVHLQLHTPLHTKHHEHQTEPHIVVSTHDILHVAGDYYVVVGIIHRRTLLFHVTDLDSLHNIFHDLSLLIR